jgi:hypothetical protein
MIKDDIQQELCSGCSGSGKTCTKCVATADKVINATFQVIIKSLESKPTFKDGGYIKLIKSLRNNLVEQEPDKSNLPEMQQIEKWLKEQRGTKSPQFAAERSAIKWMVNQGYDPNDICLCYTDMKKDKFWIDKFLSMVSVKTQIGEWKKAKRKDDPDRFIKGRYGHLVKR